MTESDSLSKGPTWIVVADAGQAHIYRRTKRFGPLELVRNLADQEAGAKEQDLVAAAPGRTFDSAGQGRHKLEPRHSEKEHRRGEFARHIVDELQAARNSGQFRQLIMVAAPAMLGELRELLDAPTGACVIAEYDKELTSKEPDVIAAFIDGKS